MVLACDPLGVNERKTSRVACKKKWPGTLCHRSLGLDHKSQLRVNMDDYFLTWHFKKTLSISSIFPKKKTRLPQIMPSPQSGLQTARPPYQATSTEGDSSRQPPNPMEDWKITVEDAWVLLNLNKVWWCLLASVVAEFDTSVVVVTWGKNTQTARSLRMQLYFR